MKSQWMSQVITEYIDCSLYILSSGIWGEGYFKGKTNYWLVII